MKIIIVIIEFFNNVFGFLCNLFCIGRWTAENGESIVGTILAIVSFIFVLGLIDFTINPGNYQNSMPNEMFITMQIIRITVLSIIAVWIFLNIILPIVTWIFSFFRRSRDDVKTKINETIKLPSKVSLSIARGGEKMKYEISEERWEYLKSLVDKEK